MPAFQRVEEIEVWKRACRVAVRIYTLTSEGQFEKDWGLRDQMRRAAVSVPSNIAEGFDRGTNAEFNRFAMIAKGSCGELKTQLYISEAIGYIEKSQVRELTDEIDQISSMIRGLSNYLKKPK